MSSRLRTTDEKFLPKNLFKLTNYVRFSAEEDFTKVVMRVLALKSIGYLRFKEKHHICYQHDKIANFDSFNWDTFVQHALEVKKDADYVLQMLKDGNIDLCGKDFSNLYNLIAGYVNRGHHYILDVTCYIYIYQRTVVPL